MKRIIFTLAILFAMINLSPGQARIEFEKALHDFGKVDEKQGHATYDFIFRNTGTAPLLVQNVKTTCGCAVPDWTRQPVEPGKTGFVRVAYDVKGRPGVIDKSIFVTSNTRPAQTTLRISGEVIPIERKQAGTFRYPAGPLRLNSMHVSLDRVYSWEKKTAETMVYNPGPDPVRVSFTNVPAFMKVSIQPATIKSGEKATIKISYDAPGKKDWGYVTDQVGMVLDNDKGKEYKLTITAKIEEDFSELKASDISNAPALLLNSKSVDAGKISKNGVAEQKLKLTNNGKSKLLIRKISSGNEQLKIQYPNEIMAGKSAEALLTFTAKGQTGEQSKSITIISNDPENPEVTLKFKVQVE